MRQAVDRHAPALALSLEHGAHGARVLADEGLGLRRGDAVQPPPQRVVRGQRQQHEQRAPPRATTPRARCPAGARAAAGTRARPPATSRRMLPAVPSRSSSTRPVSRLPAVQPRMLAACSSPTLRPLASGSSWTARCSAAEREAHEQRRQPEERERQERVEAQQRRGVPVGAEVEEALLAPVLEEPAVDRRLGRQPGDERERRARRRRAAAAGSRGTSRAAARAAPRAGRPRGCRLRGRGDRARARCRRCRPCS